MAKKLISILGSIATASVLALGCSSSSSTSSSGSATDTDAGAAVATETSLELISWWISPGEAEALQALIDTYWAKYPNVRVSNAGTGPDSDIHARIDTTPPD